MNKKMAAWGMPEICFAGVASRIGCAFFHLVWSEQAFRLIVAKRPSRGLDYDDVNDLSHAKFWMPLGGCCHLQWECFLL